VCSASWTSQDREAPCVTGRFGFTDTHVTRRDPPHPARQAFRGRIGRIGRGSEGSPDGLTYAAEILVDVGIQDAQQGKAAGFDDRGACSIVNKLSLGRMRCAIDLHDELRFDTRKVDDEAVDRILAAELPAVERAVPQDTPELGLGGGLGPAELAGMRDRLAHRGVSTARRQIDWIIPHSQACRCSRLHGRIGSAFMSENRDAPPLPCGRGDLRFLLKGYRRTVSALDSGWRTSPPARYPS